jgi:hypothetical protein
VVGREAGVVADGEEVFVGGLVFRCELEAAHRR